MERFSRDLSRTCQNYQSHNILVDLNDLRLNNQLCDVTVKVNDKEVRAHKVILASRLKYFKSRLLDQADNDDVIILENIGEANLEPFISYAYTGEIFITESNALSLLEDAHRLNEAGIKKACINFLEKHLTPHDAAQALQLANSIDCFELKIIAKKMVPIDFGELSRTAEYLSLEYENLMSILAAGDMQTTESQQMYFEGVMKWIMHDEENRKVRLVDLLSLVDMTQLNAEYLLDYFDENDNGGMEREIRTVYRNQKKQAKTRPEETSVRDEENREEEILYRDRQADETSSSAVSRRTSFWERQASSAGHSRRNEADDNEVSKEDEEQQTENNEDENSGGSETEDNDESEENVNEEQISLKLMITNMCDNTAIQFYDFARRQWSEQYVIEREDQSTSKSGAILNDQLYYVQSTRVSQENMQEHLRVIDYRTEECTTLEIRKNNLSGAAVCACERFLYLCGGITEMGQVTRRVQKYVPESNTLEAMAPLITERTGAAAVVYQGYLHVLGGRNRLQITNSVEKYDPESMEWMAFPSMCEPRRQCAVAILDGKLYACGGQKVASVEVYDPAVNRWQFVAEMNNARYGFLVIALDGKLVAIGGDRVGTIEVYDPQEDRWRMDNRLADGLQIRNPIDGFIQSR